MAGMGPEFHPPVTGAAGEIHAMGQHPLSQPLPTQMRLQQKEAQLGGVIVQPHAENAADGLVVVLDDPARLSLGVVICDEIGKDCGHEGAEGVIEPVMFGIELPVPRGQPWRVGGCEVAEDGVAHAGI